MNGWRSVPWEREPVGRTIRALLLGIALLLVTPSVSLAADCQFVLGFKTIRDLIGHSIVGECLENQRYNAIGNSEQHTTGGLLAWRKADNWTAFTDGYRTWVNGPDGLQQRLNTERFEWEADYAAITGQATTSALTRDAVRNAEYAAGLPTYGRIAVQPFLDFGDLNGDGINDAAVVLSLVDGNAVHRYLAAVLNRNGEPVHVDSAYLGLNIGLRSVTIQDGIITVKMVQLAPGDPTCCPTQKVISKLWFTNSALELLSEVPPGQLTASLQREARPAINPILAHAFHVMRSTPTGSEVAETLVRLAAIAQFEPLGDSTSRWDVSPLRITINEAYRNESPEALAFGLIWPTLGLAHYTESAEPQSWAACIARISDQHAAQAQFWLETFGKNGKQDPTQLEQGANNTLARYLDERLQSWVRSSDHYRQYCAQFGEPPPVPTPTPSPVLVLPWGEFSPADYVHFLLEEAGFKPGTYGYIIYKGAAEKYAYLAYPLFLPWLDATGRGVEDATPELWRQFFNAYVGNSRRELANEVYDYLESNAHLGPVMTTFLKAEYISSLDERVEFVARAENSMNAVLPTYFIAESLGAFGDCSGSGSSYHCWEKRRQLRDFLTGKDLATVTAIPNPWYKN